MSRGSRALGSPEQAKDLLLLLLLLLMLLLLHLVHLLLLLIPIAPVLSPAPHLSQARAPERAQAGPTARRMQAQASMHRGKSSGLKQPRSEPLLRPSAGRLSPLRACRPAPRTHLRAAVLLRVRLRARCGGCASRERTIRGGRPPARPHTPLPPFVHLPASLSCSLLSGRPAAQSARRDGGRGAGPAAASPPAAPASQPARSHSHWHAHLANTTI